MTTCNVFAVFSIGLCLGLSGCGEGDGEDSRSERGALLQARAPLEHSNADVQRLGRAALDFGLSGDAECGVTITHISYATRAPGGVPATATAGLMVPKGTAPNCSGERPVLLYAHGTTTLKSYDTADPEHTPEAALVEAFFAAHGYIVVAPNYLGYDESSLNYHPYLNAEVQAGDMIDGLRAALAKLKSTTGGTQPSNKLFVAGYSQGGHVAMATHKVLERDYALEFPVTAAAPMSGPYNLVNFGDTVVSPDGLVNIGGTLFMPYLLTSYQNSYGNIYNTPADAYQPPFDKTAPTLFPTDTPVATLMAQGLLPNDPTFRLLFGAGGLLSDAFRAAYPASNFRQGLQTNTLLGWTPKAPIALCGGLEDETVYFSNTTDMHDDFASRGVEVPVWDLEERSTLPTGPTYTDVYDDFQLAKVQAGPNVEARYHGDLVPPFCYSLVRGFFAKILSGS